MSNYSFNHISTSTDRYKIYTLLCNPSELKDKIELVKAQNIPVINLGKELAEYIDRLAKGGKLISELKGIKKETETRSKAQTLPASAKFPPTGRGG